MKFLKLFLLEIGIFLWFIGWYNFGCTIENFWLRLIPHYIAILPVHIFLYEGLYLKIYKEKQKISKKQIFASQHAIMAGLG